MLYSGNYKAFIALNQQYQKIAKERNYKNGTALCYISIAQLNTANGEYKKALIFLSKAQDILKTSDNNLHKALLNCQFSFLNANLDLKAAAMEYNNRTLNYLKTLEDSELKRALLQQTYGGIGNLTESTKAKLNLYLKARTYRKDLIIESFIANYYLMTNKADSANIYINSGLNLANKLNPVDTRKSLLYFIMGRYYTSISDYKNAKEYYQKAIDMSLATQQTYGIFIQYIYYDLITYYRLTNNAVQSDQYLQKYNHEVNKFKDQKNETASMATQKFMTDIRDEENEVHNRHTLIVMILSLLFTGLVGIFTYRQIKNLHNRRQEVKDETIQFIKKSSDNGLENLIELAKKNDSSFINRFEEIYPDFYPKLKQINPNIEKSEFLFCALLKLNFSSKEIANYTDVLHSSVQQRKRRLRRRLNIPGNADLYTFFNNL
ncbi:TPA: hypothetical protein ACWX1I_003125 [Elizabethkingia anophelis]